MENDKRSLRLFFIVFLVALAALGFVLEGSDKKQSAPSDPIEIKSYTQRLEDDAQSGDANAMFRMANDYKSGNNGVTPDSAEAIKWYEKAIKNGHSDAMYVLALMYKNGDGADVNYDKAAKLFEKAIKAGNSSAVIGLANMYYFGHGLEQSYKKAYGLWEKAAEQGNAEAMYNLSRAYYKGIGVKSDFIKAGEYLSMAADNGDDYARGLVEKYARKCSETKVGSKIYYEMKACHMAAPSEDAVAMHAAGLSFYEGLFEQVIDHEKAFEWFYRAALAGYPQAQYYVSLCYDKGYGVEASKSESYAWIGAGIVQDAYSVKMLRKAKKAKEILYGQMSAEQRLEAEEKLKQYAETYVSQ